MLDVPVAVPALVRAAERLGENTRTATGRLFECVFERVRREAVLIQRRSGGGRAHGVDDRAPGLVEAALVDVVRVRVALAVRALRPAGADFDGTPGKGFAQALGGLSQVPSGRSKGG